MYENRKEFKEKIDLNATKIKKQLLADGWSLENINKFLADYVLTVNGEIVENKKKKTTKFLKNYKITSKNHQISRFCFTMCSIRFGISSG